VPSPPRAVSRRRILLSALTLPFGVTACLGQDEKPDTGKLDRFLLSYIDALNNRDAQRLSQLLGNHTAQDIASRLKRFGGRALRDVRITHQREAPDMYVVFLSARAGASGQPFETREIASWRRKRWLLTPWPAPLQPTP
jgi:hypothetical protein